MSLDGVFLTGMSLALQPCVSIGRETPGSQNADGIIAAEVSSRLPTPSQAGQPLKAALPASLRNLLTLVLAARGSDADSAALGRARVRRIVSSLRLGAPRTPVSRAAPIL